MKFYRAAELVARESILEAIYVFLLFKLTTVLKANIALNVTYSLVSLRHFSSSSFTPLPFLFLFSFLPALFVDLNYSQTSAS